MIRVFKFKKNDINPSGGKQIEYSISDVKDFFQFSTGEETVEFIYTSVIPNDPLNGLRFKSTFKLSQARGDYKCYGNPDGSLNLKSFFLDKLHLTVEDNLEDSYALKKLGQNSFAVAYFPKGIDFTTVSRFFYSENTTTETPDSVNQPLVEPLQQIFYGAPGTGKSFTIDDTVDEENSVRTTFHPDSDYASFVGAYKPTMEDMPMSALVGTNVHPAIPMNGHSGKERKIVYKYVPQAFLKAYVAAWSNLDKPYFLVIEEINRGNCAQIFGDLFQLLDRNNAGSSSYAIHADQDIAQFLNEDKEHGFAALGREQRDAIAHFILEKDNGKTENIGSDILNGKKLLLPPNLYIWATMNTSDQSLFPIDSAFKRRWNWKYIPIEYAPIDKKNGRTIEWKVEIAGNLYSWGAFLAKINPEIYTLTESSDKQMGYFFAKADPNTGIISENVFLNKVLFYLWTDVFKDYDVSSEYFQNKKKNRSFRFTDFFDKEQPSALSDFIDNFKLDIVIDDEHAGKLQNDKGEWIQPTFLVDGKTVPSMIDTVLLSMTKYFEKYPDISIDEAVNVWNSLGLPKHALETEQVFNARTDMTKNRASKVFIAPDGRKFYVSAQLRKQHMDKLIAKAKEWGIDITRLS
ncbi:MAG: hypothetical protein HFJ87_04320 [Muribaculaceae bacterium]|mgnify:CR=1 FL=1|nr:hypothetical protein [Muribaculaceae bacterium]